MLQPRLACTLQQNISLRRRILRHAARTRNVCQASNDGAGTTSVVQQIHRDLRSKHRSATQITQQFLDGLHRCEESVGAFITVDSDAVLQAKQLDARIAKNGTEGLGPLAGVPIAIKDNICTRGTRTTAGSQMLRDYVPEYDATAVAQLRAAGAIVIGKTNMDEFGMGSSTENSSYKATRNPWDTERVPGGSSGGSAAAVAAGQCAAALGTDTGGSIRQPSHFCGVVGLKPSYGRVSRYGLVAYASSLDCIGPITTSVEDAARLLNALAGSDPADATCSTTAVPDFAAGLQPVGTLGSRPLAGRRVGLIAQTLGDGVQPEVNDAVLAAAKHLESLGAMVEEVPLPTFASGLPAYYVLALSEASSNLSRYDSVRYGARTAPAAAGAPAPSPAKELGALYRSARHDGLGAEVKRRILMGTYALSSGYYDAYYKTAQKVRTLVSQELDAALQQYDVLLSPAAPTTAYKLGEKSSDPLAMYKGDLMTVNINLAGLPAIVLPCGYASSSGSSNSSGADGGRPLPIGVQMVGRMFGEVELLQVAHIFEQTRPLAAFQPSVGGQAAPARPLAAQRA